MQSRKQSTQFSFFCVNFDEKAIVGETDPKVEEWMWFS